MPNTVTPNLVPSCGHHRPTGPQAGEAAPAAADDGAGVCTAAVGQPADPLEALWTVRDTARYVAERLHANLRLELERLAGADRARELLGSLGRCTDLADSTTKQVLAKLLSVAPCATCASLGADGGRAIMLSQGRPNRTGGAAPAAAPGDDAKTLATLRARAALAGWTPGAFTEPDGKTSYLLSRWGKTRALLGLPAVAHFLRQVGA